MLNVLTGLGEECGGRWRSIRWCASCPAPIATKIEPGHDFCPAEANHQDYLTLHPTQPYIAIKHLPKLNELKRLFPDQHRPTPVLVASAQPAR